MTPRQATQHRLSFLARVVAKEARHLNATAARLFSTPFTFERASKLDSDPDLSERVDAFVARFGRLQDTLGDKLLPALMTALGENLAPKIDVLDRAERLGLIPSAEAWMQWRVLRNQMVHEYVDDLRLLADALETAREAVPSLTQAAEAMIAEIERRGWS
jgi:hypothetical protein